MKYITIIFLLYMCFYCTVANAQPFYGNNTIVNRAQKFMLDKAKRENKDIVLFFSAGWCDWCTKMQKETLRDKEVKRELSKYLTYKIDIDKHKELIKEYKVGPVPTYLLISKEGKILKRGVGYLSPKKFLEFLEKGG